MAFPATLTAPPGTAAQGNSQLTSPDHALDHRTLGSAVIGIESNLGTNSGTNVLGAFVAGNFPVRINASAVLQTVIGGTVNLAGGTITGQLVNSGTVGGGVYGTASYVNGTISAARFTGGTIDASLVGTSQITGGTLTASALQGQLVSTGTIGGGMLGTTAIQGGTATSIVEVNPTIRGGTTVYHALGSLTYIGTASTTQTLQCGSATRHLVNMSNSAGSVTLAVAGAIESQPFIVEIMQGTAGLGTINWFSTIRWQGSAVPTQTLTASRKDTFGFIATSTTTFDGYIIGQNV